MLEEVFGDLIIRCSSDQKNYTLSRRSVGQSGKSKGKPTESILGYHGNLQSAVKEVARLNADLKPSLVEWLAEYKRVFAEFSARFEVGVQ